MGFLEKKKRKGKGQRNQISFTLTGQNKLTGGLFVLNLKHDGSDRDDGTQVLYPELIIQLVQTFVELRHNGTLDVLSRNRGDIAVDEIQEHKADLLCVLLIHFQDKGYSKLGEGRLSQDSLSKQKQMRKGASEEKWEA